MFILASSSPRRLDLLREAFFVPDEIIAADIDESVLKGESASIYCKRVAIAKYEEISRRFEGAVILSADTTVALGARILGKPENAEEASRFLKMLSGRQHRVYTCVVVGSSKGRSVKLCRSFVTFKRISDKDIDLHIESGQWKGKAGGYMINGFASSFVKKISGEVTTIIGLPMLESVNLLEQHGVKRQAALIAR